METRAHGSERERSVDERSPEQSRSDVPRHESSFGARLTETTDEDSRAVTIRSVDHLPAASSLFRISIRRLALVSNSPSYPSNGTHRSSMSIPAALHFSMASYWFVRI